ncbi:MAG: hypothetical protein AB9861_00380 [Methanosarcina sp.]|jgi:hypothetical protein
MPHDVFISHAHSDTELAVTVERWLLAMWPSMEIYRSKPDDTGLPFFFQKNASSSRVVLFLATEASIVRPMVQFELCTMTDKHIITILAGASLADVIKMRERDLYCGIETDKIVNIDDPDGWYNLACLIASVLSIDPPGKIPDIPTYQSVRPIDTDINNITRDFWNEMVKFYMTPSYRYQTEDDAKRLLAIVEKRLFEIALAESIIIQLDRLPKMTPRARLISILCCMTREKEMAEMIRCFPALIDDELLYLLQKIEKASRENSSDISEILAMAIEIVESMILQKELGVKYLIRF